MKDKIIRQKYNKDEVLLNLKQYIEELGYVPNYNKMKQIHYKPSMTWFKANFGSYENALNLIGYKSIITNEDLIQILHDFYNKNGRSPYTTDMKNSNGLPSTEMYYGRFNTQSWNEILKIAGLKFNHVNYDKEYGEQYGLDRLREFYIYLGRLPKKEDFVKYHWTPTDHYYNDKYGGVINSLYKAGLIDKPLSEKERINISIQELVELSNNLQRCPSVDEYDLNKLKGYDRRELEKHIGMKYNDICKKYLKYNVNFDRDVTQDEIIDSLLEHIKLFGYVPMYKELKEYGWKYNQSIIESKFGYCYNSLIKNLGFKPTGTDTLKRDKNTLLDDFYNYFLQLGHVPSYEEITNNVKNMASHSTYLKYFGSIENVCELLDIDYCLYYTGKYGTGRICFDNNGSLCRSLPEQQITNYLIDNNITYEKETGYNEIIPNCRKRFDWKIYRNNQIFYVEYFGMYNSKSNGKISKQYKQRTQWKIKQLCKRGYSDNCIFIFPNDLKTKSLDKIFEKILNKINKKY